MSNFSKWERSSKFINALTRLDSNKKLNIQLIKKAVHYAKKYHAGQFRKTGEPYYTHPLEVALLFADYAAHKQHHYFTTELIATAILHDTIEDTTLSLNEITREFGNEVAFGVQGLTRHSATSKIRADESLEKLIRLQRYDLALIKIFDRIHNLQTLRVKSKEKAYKTINETLKSFMVFCMAIEDTFLEHDIRQLCYQYIDSQTQFPILPENDLFSMEFRFPIHT